MMDRGDSASAAPDRARRKSSRLARAISPAIRRAPQDMIGQATLTAPLSPISAEPRRSRCDLARRRHGWISRLYHVSLHPRAAARAAFGARLEVIAAQAFRAIARVAKGFEVAHLQFRRERDVVAVCSQVRRSGEIEIEIDVGTERLPAVSRSTNGCEIGAYGTDLISSTSSMRRLASQR
jgi:hypothetical protein